jgi:hypothetical protein
VAPGVAPGQSAIWAEAVVNRDTPYAQESVVYTVRVFSPGNLQSVEITPPPASGMAVEELERGTPSTRVARGRRHVVNEFHYVLTPVAAGRLEVGPARLSVKLASDARSGPYPPWGTTSQGAPVAVSTAPVTLTVLPLPPGAPMPLRYLDVKAHWAQEGVRSVGEPITLTVVVKGVGATGGRLPSVAAGLGSPDFRIYPDRPQVDWKWGGEDGHLWGRRVETFTLVPTREGSLRFPAIDLAWWDIDSNRAAHARVPERTVPVGTAALARHAAGGDSGEHFMKRLLTQKALLQYVLPVGGGIALALLLGWLVGVVRLPGAGVRRESDRVPPSGEPGRPTAVPGERRVGWLSSVASRLRAVGATLGGPVLGFARSGVAAVARVPDRLLASLPASVQAWWCTHCAVRQVRPEGLCRVLRRFACRSLHMGPNAPMAMIAERIAGERPGESSASLSKVFRELDEAAYAGRRLDLKAWKREFRRRFRGALAERRRAQRVRSRRGLPGLNP